MDFGLSQTQRILQDGAMRFLQDQISLDTLKDKASWPKAQQGFDQLGMNGMMLAPDHGGMDASLLDAALVQEALGYFVAPVNFMASQILAPLAVQEAGSPAQQSEYLAQMAAGKMRASVAISALSGRRKTAISSDNGKLSGTAKFVMDEIGSNATHILIADEARDLFLISADDAEMKPLKTIDQTRQFSEINLNNLPAMKLAGENRPGQAAARTLAAGRILLAADMLGCAQSMIARAVAYALERQQFGRVIGSFQAVKHLCAEMAAQLEPCRAMLWFAAHCFDTRFDTPSDKKTDDPHLMACLTKAHVGDVARFVARTATEVHGGMGFAADSGLHFWFKRIGASRQLLGASERLREEAAQIQGWSQT